MSVFFVSLCSSILRLPPPSLVLTCFLSWIHPNSILWFISGHFCFLVNSHFWLAFFHCLNHWEKVSSSFWVCQIKLPSFHCLACKNSWDLHGPQRQEYRHLNLCHPYFELQLHQFVNMIKCTSNQITSSFIKCLHGIMSVWKNQRPLGQFAHQIKMSLLYVHHCNVGNGHLRSNCNATKLNKISTHQ